MNKGELFFTFSSFLLPYENSFQEISLSVVPLRARCLAGSWYHLMKWSKSFPLGDNEFFASSQFAMVGSHHSVPGAPGRSTSMQIWIQVYKMLAKCMLRVSQRLK